MPHVPNQHFGPDGAAAIVLRDQELYAGVRVTMPCTLAVAKVAFHIDVNSGDPIAPRPTNVAPTGHGPCREDRHRDRAWNANTRWRDFVDIYLLSRTRDQDAAEPGRLRGLGPGEQVTPFGLRRQSQGVTDEPPLSLSILLSGSSAHPLSRVCGPDAQKP